MLAWKSQQSGLIQGMHVTVIKYASIRTDGINTGPMHYQNESDHFGQKWNFMRGQKRLNQLRPMSVFFMVEYSRPIACNDCGKSQLLLQDLWSCNIAHFTERRMQRAAMGWSWLVLLFFGISIFDDEVFFGSFCCLLADSHATRARNKEYISVQVIVSLNSCT